MISLLATFIASTAVTLIFLRFLPAVDPAIVRTKATGRELLLIGSIVTLCGIGMIVFAFIDASNGSVQCMWPRSCHELIKEAVDPARFMRHMHAWVACAPFLTLIGIALLSAGIKVHRWQP